MNLIQSSFLTISLSIIPVFNPAPVEVYQAPIERTYQTEFSRLAKKYNQNPVLAQRIIDCEGLAYKRIGNNKNYRNGVMWSTDIGWWQINDYYHEQNALKLGLDIHNEWDNLEYGFILMSEQGTSPWNASKSCWST